MKKLSVGFILLFSIVLLMAIANEAKAEFGGPSSYFNYPQSYGGTYSPSSYFAGGAAPINYGGSALGYGGAPAYGGVPSYGYGTPAIGYGAYATASYTAASYQSFAPYPCPIPYYPRCVPPYYGGGYGGGFQQASSFGFSLNIGGFGLQFASFQAGGVSGFGLGLHGFGQGFGVGGVRPYGCGHHCFRCTHKCCVGAMRYGAYGHNGFKYKQKQVARMW